MLKKTSIVAKNIRVLYNKERKQKSITSKFDKRFKKY